MCFVVNLVMTLLRKRDNDRKRGLLTPIHITPTYMYSKVHDIHDNKYVSRTIDHKITHAQKNTDLQRHSPETEASALLYVVVRACHRACEET